jgi:secreted PhoX family phosphatase
MAEENFNGYFWGKEAIEAHPEANVFKRYGIPGAWYNWGQYHDRFDIAKEPNEANRFGWIVEVDPRDPASTPIKRTALGRFKHEGAEPVVNHDGRVVIYSGDDQRFDYLYKFVSVGVFDPDAPDTNHDLLDQGTLYVAKFDADGTLSWLPLVHGEGPLIAENGFPSQADVLISTRLAADLLGATPMDRPEDVGVNHSTGKAYVMLTSNDRRTAEQTDAIHTRAENHWGLVLEITPLHGDHASNRGHWAVLVSCGDPAEKTIEARWNPATSENGWFSNPDNCAVDPDGGLWVATDQGSLWQQNSGSADGLWALETEGEARGTGRMFFRVPVGAELCGPCFTDDGQTLFLAVQHPAADGTKRYGGFGRASSFQDPATRWPDFREGVPPRPSVVVVTRRDGGRIGG